MSAMQRRKGAGYERELVRYFNETLGPVARRCWERAMDKGHDIDLPGFAIEAKRMARIGKVYEWMEQAVEQAKSADMPVVICRADGKESLVIVRLPDFVKLAREEICADPESL